MHRYSKEELLEITFYNTAVLERKLTTVMFLKAASGANSHKYIWKLHPNFCFTGPLLCLTSLSDFASSSLFLLMFAPVGPVSANS